MSLSWLNDVMGLGLNDVMGIGLNDVMSLCST